MRKRVAVAVKIAKRCRPRWYGISMLFRICPQRNRRRSIAGMFPETHQFIRHLFAPETYLNVVILSAHRNSLLRFHRLNDGVRKLRGARCATHVASELAAVVIDHVESVADPSLCVVFSEMAEHKQRGA